MKTTSVDCLKLKADAQRRCAKKLDGLSIQEQRKTIDKAIHANPLLHPVYERAKTVRFGKVAEAMDPFQYGSDRSTNLQRNKDRINTTSNAPGGLKADLL